MIKIGFVDFYLDNWHTNHYPAYIREIAAEKGLDIDICYAYAFRDAPGDCGLTTDGWCNLYHVEKCNSYAELVEKSDAIMVMGADDCQEHEQLAHEALMSGKPVYCDKTFAKSVETAQRMFDLAREYKTPIFSSSAQRYCPEIMSFTQNYKERVDFAASTGPGDMINYSVHQFEMIVAVLGTGVKSCKATSFNGIRHIIYEYEDDRMCTFTQAPNMPFHLFAGNHETGICEMKIGDYYRGFFLTLFKFFEDKQVPVPEEETMEVMKLQQLGREALGM